MGVAFSFILYHNAVLYFHHFSVEFNSEFVPLATLTFLMTEHAEDIFKIYEIIQ